MADDPNLNTGGDALRVKAEALGEPGQRRFRLLAVIDGETRIVWLEKEQLRRLGQALEQVLENLPDRGPEIVSAGVSVAEFQLDTRHQIRAGRMELGYDEQRNRLIILAHDLENDESGDPAFVCRLSPGQARELAEEAEIVVSAGRPICPLCGRPMASTGHSCEKQNGHYPHRIEEVEDNDDDV
ncbi:MAG: DUF3090 family protein [Thermomicrobiales bacterium]|nr:DUF3090 family protein [Thermomicrobiales bacterium]